MREWENLTKLKHLKLLYVTEGLTVTMKHDIKNELILHKIIVLMFDFKRARPATHRKTENERQLADGRGGRDGRAANHMTAREPGPL
jgi:hypothetical protein